MILNAISSGFTLYFNNFLAFTKIFLFPILIIGLLSTTADYLSSLSEDYFVITGLIFAFQIIFLTPLYTGMAILIGRDLRSGSLNKLIGYFIVSAQLALKIFILQVMIGIMTIIGLVLFIIPGLYIQFRFTYSVYYLVLEGNSILGSLDNLWNESREVHWSLFNTGVLLTLITITFVLIVYAILGLSSQEEISLVLSFIGNCITIYLQMILIAFPMYSIYQLILKKNQ
jgi:hypothetical protein